MRAHARRTPQYCGGTTLSDHLLDALGRPRVQIAARCEGAAPPQNLTCNDLYAYVYLQAREIDRQVVGHLDSWFEPKRKELFRLMFALTDSVLLELKTTAEPAHGQAEGPTRRA
ncbi:hypothetical protein [Streptomyces sp. NPDC003015]